MLEIQLCAAEVFGAAISGRNLGTAFDEGFRRHASLKPGERAAVREICYDGLRAYGLLREQLARLLVTPIRHPGLSHLLLVALAQLQFSRAKPYAVVDHAVRAAERLGQPAARGLVNAVLRNFLRRRAELSPAAFSSPEAAWGFPAWWIDKVRADHPAHWESMLSAMNRHPPMTLRVNRRKSSVEAYLERLAGEGIPGERIGDVAVRISPRPVVEVPGFGEGWVSVQDAGAQLAAPLLDASDGHRVLDACAAPGGKTTHVLELARAEVTALDNDRDRLPRVRENLDRLGFEARLALGDVREPAGWWDGRPYDRILLDAPCSASGVARRHPDVRWNRRPDDLPRFADQQSGMLAKAWQVLEKGGKLLYVTCSIFREENQAVVQAFLARQGDAVSLPIAGAGLDDGQTRPDEHRDGFFFALLGRT